MNERGPLARVGTMAAGVVFLILAVIISAYVDSQLANDDPFADGESLGTAEEDADE